LVTLGYVSYLALVSFVSPIFRPARPRALLAAAVAWTACAAAWFSDTDLESLSEPALIVVPALILLLGYWLSGLFFVRPQPAIERRLLRLDRAVLPRMSAARWAHGAPRLLLEYLELSYLLVYALLPAGAVVMAVAGEVSDVARFWTVVLLAEFACYAVLPWIRTRPPRVLEDPVGSPPAIGIRRLNLAIARRASIQANTLPSAHTAGAVAAALCVIEISPNVGAAFMLLAVSIALATVAGRYHYFVDSVLGALLAAASWRLIG
jgi:membrane-associated phospholipid phosphatase